MKVLREGADKMKNTVDADYDTGFPIMSFMLLVVIFGMLYSIWLRINPKLGNNGTKSSGKPHSY